MKLVKKILAAVLALGMSGVLLAGCSDGAGNQSVAKIKEAGEIVMYTNAAFAPFEYVDGQDVKGVDVEIALEIAKELGVELKVKDVKFDSIVPGIESGKAAFGAAGITITDDRKKSVDFSIEYYTSVQYIICKEDADFAKTEDLAGKAIGVQLGTTGDFLVSDAIDGTEDEETKEHVKGVLEGTGASCKQYANAIEASQDLMNGRIDAVVIDKLPAESIVNNNSGLKCVKLEDAEPEAYGICVAKGNEELLKVIDEVLNRLISEGKIDSFVLAHSNA